MIRRQTICCTSSHSIDLDDIRGRVHPRRLHRSRAVERPQAVLVAVGPADSDEPVRILAARRIPALGIVLGYRRVDSAAPRPSRGLHRRVGRKQPSPQGNSSATSRPLLPLVHLSVRAPAVCRVIVRVLVLGACAHGNRGEDRSGDDRRCGCRSRNQCGPRTRPQKRDP